MMHFSNIHQKLFKNHVIVQTLAMLFFLKILPSGYGLS